MTTMKFKGHENAQAYVITDGTDMILVSYTTSVITLRDGWLHVNGLYSATTRKHIGWFMKELGFSYQLAKQIYNDNMDFNIYTGEVVNNESR